MKEVAGIKSDPFSNLHDFIRLFENSLRPQKKEKTMTDKKHFVVAGRNDCLASYETQDEAILAAKRRVGDKDCCSGYDTYTVYQAVALVTAPVPEAIVTTL